MSMVNVIIKGIAICYQKNGVWKVLFPFDECHQVKLFQQSGSESQVPLGPLSGASNTIEIQTQGATSATGTHSSFSQIFNLTSSIAHQSGVRPLSSWRANGVSLTIPNAVFHLDEAYQVDFVLIGNGTEVNVGRIGRTSVAKINLGQNGSLRVISGGTEVFAHSGDAPLTLTFDNDCPPEEMEEGQNDFDMLYDIVEDSVTPALKFRLVPETTSGGGDSEPGGKPCENVSASVVDFLP